MAGEPIINPMYEISKALSDEWPKGALRMVGNTSKIWSRLDIAFMSAICASSADLETRKLMNDCNGWVFAFDGRFDDGTFANVLVGATEEVIYTRQEEVIYTLSVLDDIHPIISPNDNPLRHTLQSCWMRFKSRSSIDAVPLEALSNCVLYRCFATGWFSASGLVAQHERIHGYPSWLRRRLPLYRAHGLILKALLTPHLSRDDDVWRWVDVCSVIEIKGLGKYVRLKALSTNGPKVKRTRMIKLP